MTEQALPEESPLIADRARSTAGPVGGGATVHPEVLAWLKEARRLFEEAEERLESGAVLPALSSLATLVTRCGSAATRTADWADARRCSTRQRSTTWRDSPSGLYL